MPITPLILGSGRAGHALAKSLACLKILRPELELEFPVWLEREANLTAAKEKFPSALLCICNPHALHASAIIKAEDAGYAAILCEKPACINLEQLAQLRKVKVPVALLHIYRQTWGVQFLKRLLDEKSLGEIIAIEGRYWQASTAERALQTLNVTMIKGWKDDPLLSGEYDTFLDLGTHWVDAVSFLMDAAPDRIQGWRSYINAETPHRDSHVQLTLDYPQGRAFGSISKTVHGATNHFEIHVMGSTATASWNFLQPDEVQIGKGRDRRVVTRKDSELGSRQPPHHGMGWLEGYIEIASRLLDDASLHSNSSYPSLASHLDTLEAMLKTEWYVAAR